MLRRSLQTIRVTVVLIVAGWNVLGQDIAQTAKQPPTLSRYFDPQTGMTAEEAVAYALSHNSDLLAASKEIEAARALVRQAALRANPMIDVERKEQLNGSDNDTMVGATLPLELGGRRSARILVAQRELEMKEQLLTDRERVLAAEVKAKFGQALGEMLKLAFTENLLTTTDRGYRLVTARVDEGRTAPCAGRSKQDPIIARDRRGQSAGGAARIAKLNRYGARGTSAFAWRSETCCRTTACDCSHYGSCTQRTPGRSSRASSRDTCRGTNRAGTKHRTF
jgi:hypothetical protein